MTSPPDAAVQSPRPASRTASSSRIDAAAEWSSRLARFTGAVLLFEIVSGFVIYLSPFGRFPQVTVLVHTAIGVTTMVPVVWYLIRHWRVRRHGKLSHYQALGYIAAAFLAACFVSGLIGTWQGALGPSLSYFWDTTHLVTGIAFFVVIIVHLVTVLVRKVNNAEARARLQRAQRGFWASGAVGCTVALAACGIWASLHGLPDGRAAFAASYNWSFGNDRPFAPSKARMDHSDIERMLRDDVIGLIDVAARPAFVEALDAPSSVPGGFVDRLHRAMDAVEADDTTRQTIEAAKTHAESEIRARGAIDARHLAGSTSCGTSGCHEEIYAEWLPSAHRYSSMDDMFQRVQTLMATEMTPEHTRYCAGCHDPISLFSGAKNADNVTLSSLGADEGTSCLVCHTIVQTDVQGNGDYTVRLPERYAYELSDGATAKFLSDFLIRAYPRKHIESYARSLYKTPEFCGACHKQYLDTEVNTDIGKVQGQNQYDSWKNSRWYHEGNPERTVGCRECHMPLADSRDPARGDATDGNRTTDDGKHRGHRMLASNQYMPLLLGLEGAEEHVELTEKWLRGEYEIPEIAHKWTEGPVVRMAVLAPESVRPGERVAIRVTLANNKTGHDFPTGPLDMIESWVEVTVTDDAGTVLHHVGGVGASGAIEDSPLLMKAIEFDRRGELIDRHNLWDMVGASYKRSIYPGVTDTVTVEFQCPSLARGRLQDADTRDAPGARADDFAFDAPEVASGVLHVSAVLWYRKANPEFIERVYGADSGLQSPATRMSSANATIELTSGPPATPTTPDDAQGTE